MGWFDNFPKLDFGLSPQYIAQTRQYVSRSYSAAIIVSGIGIGLGLLLHKFKDPTDVKENKKISTAKKEEKKLD